MFKVGDDVCYSDTEGENNEPRMGIVLAVEDQIKISYHNTSGQQIVWVDASTLKLQEKQTGCHNAECGWCGDTGICIYE